MGKGDEFKEYKKSKLTSGDIGIRIIGTTEDLEQMEKLLKEEFSIARISDIYKLNYPDNIFVRYFKIKDK